MSKLGQVDVRERVSYQVDDCQLPFVVVLSCEGVGHDIFESGDVGNISHELTDKRELVSLLIQDEVACFEESTGERLLILEYPETSSLEHVAEFYDRGINREKFQVVRRVARFGGHCAATEETEGLQTAFDNLVDSDREGLGARICVDAEFGV